MSKMKGVARNLAKKRKHGKFAKVMREFAAGNLHHGSTGKIVTRPDVAKAIAASEAGMSRKKKRS